MDDKEYSFEKLGAYQAARKLVKDVYVLLRKFPVEERYALCDQLRRAAISVPSNIAEGMSRRSPKEQMHFLEISFGSAMEVLSQMQLSLDLDYITESEYKSIRSQLSSTAYIINQLHKSIESRI